MLKSKAGHSNYCLIGGITIGLNNYGATFFAREVELRPQIIDRNLLIPKIDRRRAGNANNLVFYLWA